jgi:hypothetical protein
MRAPWTRAWTPAAMVSTSGSSGIGIRVLRLADGAEFVCL